MGDLLGSLVWGAKSGQYCVIGVGRYTLALALSLSLRQYCTTSQLPDHRLASLPDVSCSLSLSLSVNTAPLASSPTTAWPTFPTSLALSLFLSLLNLLVQENHMCGFPFIFFLFQLLIFFHIKKKN
jgi:hypothetical protein